MAKLTIYDATIPREIISAGRENAYLDRTSEQRFFCILKLNYISVTMNGGRPLKSPQGKGLIIRKAKS